MTLALPRTAVSISRADDGFVDRRRLRRLGLRKPVPFARLLGVLLVLAAWSAGIHFGLLDERKLSAPWTVLGTGWDLFRDGTLGENVAASLRRASLGLSVGVLAGTGLALLSGLSRLGESLIDGPLQVKRAIPTLGLIPLMILWLGIGETFKIVLITFGVLITMYLQTHASLTTIDKRFVELSEVQGVSRWQFIRRVVIPGSLRVPAKTSVIFQDSRLLPWQRVLTNVLYGQPRTRREAAKAVLSEVGLAGRERAWPSELSGGEQQRVALARALAGEPQLLLADEPFGALDALTRIRMHELLRELIQRHTPTVLLVTHDVDEAITLAQRVLVLDAGRLTVDLPIELPADRDPGQPEFQRIRRTLLTALGVVPAGV